jgi:NADH-quinone oxidoreductase subunit M
MIGLFVRSERQETLYWLASLIAVVELFVALFLYMGWIDDPAGRAQFVDGPWTIIDALGVRYHLGVDGLNLYLVLLTTLVTPIAVLAAWPQESQETREAKPFAFWVLLLEAGVVGALTSLDLMLFVPFWLLAVLSMFFLIGHSAGGAGAARRFMVAMAIAAALMSVAAVGRTASLPGGSAAGTAASPLSWPTQALLFWCMLLALGISSAAFPLHLWHPDAHRHSAPAVRLLMSSLFVHLGIYAVIRFCLGTFPLAAASFAPALAIVGAVGTVYAGLAALGQVTFAGTLVYWNIAQVGLALAGIATLEHLGIHGAVIQMVARGLATGVLILFAPVPDGSEDHHPASAGQSAALCLGTLSAIGVPGLVGFVGQTVLLLGILRWHWQVSEVVLINRAWDWAFYASIAFGLMVGMWALLRAWRSASGPSMTRMPANRAVIALPLLVLILVLGLRPARSSDVIGPAVHRVWEGIHPPARSSLLERAPTEPVPDWPQPPDDQHERTTYRVPQHPADSACRVGLQWAKATCVLAKDGQTQYDD